MSGKTNITYLFDPLCGWCYGASGIIGEIAAHPNLTVALAPTGLFSGAGARPMNAQFAAFAWSNDERIASLSGQRFTDDYRNDVLGKGGVLDSGPATLALTAVALTDPLRELDALTLIQEARYVSGGDVTDMLEVKEILESAGLDAASNRLVAPDADLLSANRQRIEAARVLMKQFRVDGVPVLIVDDGQRRSTIRAQELFGNADLVARLAGVGAFSADAVRQNRS
ncbi:DsbA family protein [Rhizobium leguminosarum]|uniref:DsbA family protein n=1 Tax=Rhizobium leguminosarum TaxID=384 RepID=UPI0014427D55|nr:DsbA family protein [Rhizobium leguminosarum]NKL66883.1 DsbA family protein [Rhizobium leguminosarum bv. viciae]